MKRVMFVDDEPHVLDSLRDALRPRRREWQMTFARDGATALAALAEAECDVVVSDMRMPGMDGATLLAQVGKLHPRTVRIVLSGYAELDAVARAAAVAHRFLAKPCDVAELARVIERSCALNEMTEREATDSAAISTTRLPSVPALYMQLSALLADSDVTVHDAARVLEQDVAMTAKVLQLANSAFFSRGPAVTGLGEAVARLGLSTLNALVLAREALGAFGQTAPIKHLSIEALQHHGMLVARVARRLLGDAPAREAAFTAGLLHDIGLLVMASHDAPHLEQVLATAHRDRRPLAEVEREGRGVTHAEVGAHLLALWGLPHEIVEAVAYQHRPQDVHDPVFDAVAALHIADALVHERVASRDPDSHLPAEQLDHDYLNRLGVASRLGEWRAIVAHEAEEA
jgi:HD-like signal output (HDOD) protein